MSLTRYMPLLALMMAAALLAGCSGPQRLPPIEVWPDMDRQEKFKAQSGTALFADGRSNRPPVAGTVAVGQLKEDAVFSTGLENGQYAGKNPLEVTPELLKQGQRRFNTYCSPCHDRTGQGGGVVPKKAAGWIPTNLMDPRILGTNDGELFNVISHGRRSMPGYRFQIVERDRWAIVAYVRALQRSTLGTVEDVPAELRSELR